MNLTPKQGPMLVPNWRRVLRYSYSIRLNIFATFLFGVEFLLPYIPQIWPVPTGAFAAFGCVVTILAGIARLIPQPKISGENNEQA